MSTEKTDLERMARDIFAEASPMSEWETATDQRREFCIGMAKHLRSMGYTYTIVHSCCETAVAMEDTLREAKHDAWAEGYTSGHSRAMRAMSDKPSVQTPTNPYT